MLKKAIEFLLFSNTAVAISAFAFFYRTYKIFNLQTDWDLIFLISFSAFFVYNLSKAYPFWEKKELDLPYQDERYLWTKKHLKWITFLIFLAAFGVIFFVFSIQFYEFLFLTHLAVIAIFYTVPFLHKPLRAFKGLKIFLLAYVWASVVSFLPFIKSESDVFSWHHFIFFADNFLFIIAITIPFDIRDFKKDKQQNLITIPHFLGVRNSKNLSIGLILGCMVLPFFYLPMLPHFYWKNFIGLLLIIGLLLFSDQKHNYHYYLAFLDGTLVIRLIATL